MSHEKWKMIKAYSMEMGENTRSANAIWVADKTT